MPASRPSSSAFAAPVSAPLDSCAHGPCFHSSTSLSRPCSAAQVFSASTATPVASGPSNGSPGFGPGITTTSTTPATLRACVSSYEASVPSRYGQRAITATSALAAYSSMPKRLRPVAIACASTTGVGLPMMWKRSGVFSGTGRSGSAIEAALRASAA